MNQENKPENTPEENDGADKRSQPDENKLPAEENPSSHEPKDAAAENETAPEEENIKEEETAAAAEQAAEQEEAAEEEVHFQKLNKSRKNKIIFGVCGGLGKYFNVDPVIFRLLFVLSLLLGGWGLLVYFIAGIILPYDPEETIGTSAEPREDTVERSRENSRMLIGSSLILLGLFALLRSTGLIHYFTFFGLTNEIIMPIILIAIGIFLIYRYDFNYAGRVTDESSPVSKRLHLSLNNKKIAGVCGGLGEYFGIDPNLIRVLWLIFTFSSFGVGILIYILFAIIVPKEEKGVRVE